MATKVARLEADLALNSASFESGAERARQAFQKTQQQIAGDVGTIKNALGSITGAISGFAAGFLGAASAVAGLSAAVSASLDEYRASEQAFLRLQAVLKATGNTTGLAADQIDDLSNSIEATTLASDDLAKTAAARLATFGTITGNVFREALTLSQDLAAVFGEDMAASAEKLGRALDDPANGLKGLTREVRAFSPEAQAAVKHLADIGDAAGAQQAILTELERVVGGAGEAEASGLTGAFKKAADGARNLGAAIVEASGTGELLTKLFERFGQGANYLASKPDLGQQVVELTRQQAAAEEELAKAQAGPLSGSPAVQSQVAELQQQIAGIKAKTEALIDQGREEVAAGKASEQRAQDERNARIEAQRSTDAQETLTNISKGYVDALDAEAKKAQAAEEVRQTRISDAQFEAEAAKRLSVANQESADTYETVRIAIEAERAARQLGTDATAAERAAIEAATTARLQNADAIKKTNDARQEEEQQQKRVAQVAKEAQDKADRDQEAAAQRQAELLSKPFENALDDIQSSFADTFQKIFDGGVTSFSDLATAAKEIFTRLAAQIATLALFNPGLLLGGASAAGSPAAGGFQSPLGLGSLFGGGTLGSAFPSIFGAGNTSSYGSVAAGPLASFGGVGLGGLFTAGGLGFAGGGLLASLTGGNQIGGSIGGGLGAALGFGLGGPFGAIAGGLGGSLLGSLLGGGQKNDPNNNFGGTFSGGVFTAGKATNPDAGIQAAITGIGATLASVSQSLTALGATLGSGSLNLQGGLHHGYQLDGVSYGSADELAAAALRKIVQGATNLPAGVVVAASRSTATNAQDFLRDINTPGQIANLIHPASEFKTALDAITTAFKAANDNAVRLHLSTMRLDQAEQQRIRTLKAAAEAQISQLQGSLGSTVSGAFGFLDPIRAANSNISLTTGRPVDQYQAALTQFQSVQAGIGRGEVGAFNLLPQVGQQLIAAAQARFGGGAGAADIVEQVRATFDLAIKQGEDAQKPLLALLGEQANKQQTLIDVQQATRVIIQQLLDQITSLRRDLAAAA